VYSFFNIIVILRLPDSIVYFSCVMHCQSLAKFEIADDFKIPTVCLFKIPSIVCSKHLWLFVQNTYGCLFKTHGSFFKILVVVCSKHLRLFVQNIYICLFKTLAEWRSLTSSGNRPTLPQCGIECAVLYRLRSRDVKRQ